MVNSLLKIYSLANEAKWDAMLRACADFEHIAGSEQLLELANALLAFGFVSEASRLCAKAPSFRSKAILARIATECAEHGQARRYYKDLIRQYPNSGPLRSNALLSLQYEDGTFDRLAQAKEWGQWAVTSAGGLRPRPAKKSLKGRPLHVGLVSGDLCNHTVGLFVKEVIKSFDIERVRCWAYSTGSVRDWVTQELERCCTLRNVQALDDAALAARVQSDGIDVLVDLSGHTGGSRLTAFALRPAPVMVSWLGYFATTGLPYMDAVLLDPWHAPPGTEAEFVERIIRLPSRFCYQSVPWTPEIEPRREGPITFGSFNNTAKLNAHVYDIWSRILRAVPDSRMVLKWRTFNDESFRNQVSAEFIKRGIARDRLDLRGPSFHRDLFKQHAEIDIALDPFPFTGGLTSCEALWMGIPVVTWPQGRVVSRQTHALLNIIGLSELSAKNADDYVHIASELAQDQKRLASIRASLRQRMRASPLMDLQSYTRTLEKTFIELFESTGNQPMPTIKINNQDYDTDTLPDAAKQQLQMLAVTDAEIKRLQTQLAIAQTARNAYARALAEAVKPPVPSGDTLKL